VSNTSPILNLALTDKLFLIREQFTTVAIYLKISLSKVQALKIKILQKTSPNALNLKPALLAPLNFEEQLAL